MPEFSSSLSIAVFGEILAIDQLARNRISKALPRGMELSHFSVLNSLARSGGERTPAQLARTFHLTRGAMTNTLSKLEWAGWVHVRPDWDDARRKLVSLSPAGLSARNAAVAAIAPIIDEVSAKVGEDRMRATLPVLRELRQQLEGPD